MTDKYNIESSIRGCLVGALLESHGNGKKLAELTGLSRATCYRLLKKYGLSLKEIRDRARNSKLG